MGRLSGFQTFLGWGLEAATSFSDGDNTKSELDESYSDWDSSTTVEKSQSSEFLRSSRGFHISHWPETGNLPAERTAFPGVDTQSQLKGNIEWFEDVRNFRGSGSRTEGNAETFMWQLEWKMVDFPDSQARARIWIKNSPRLTLNPAAPTFVPSGTSNLHEVLPLFGEQDSLHQHQQYYPWQNQTSSHPRFRAFSSQRATKDESFSHHDGYMTSLEYLPGMGWPPLQPLRIPKHRKKRYPASHGRVCRQLIPRNQLEGLRISCEQIFSAEYHRKGRYYSEESDKEQAKEDL
ncbi:hypothetical protein HYALB_00013847 [Hymenoscyphus albidus]|uniref:Uncharacterized protein n=1 Tax=Hymenoscyphus albidus TaxID=595503 RepID=A0A9N9LVU2_9HELO|nr:hypothetical protein HYALB_00013847 [Hymenoscyphus albidus]